MGKIRLLYVENVITRKKKPLQQRLTFLLSVENAAYDKTVEVFWAGEEGVWQVLTAQYLGPLGHDREYWQAEVDHQLTGECSLPGNIEFSLRYRAGGDEYWHKNGDGNFSSQADSGLQLAADIELLNIGWTPALADRQKFVAVTVAVKRSLAAEKVSVHWTTDQWRTSHKSRCLLHRKFWDNERRSNARNPNQYGVEIWRAWLKIGNAFRVQYSIACETPTHTLWDNNHGRNYALSHEPLKVMILNLHCYQEDNQDYKLSQIARAIDDLNADLVCLQEVAEHWNNGHGDWDSNAAKIINDRLAAPFHLYTDWAHLGFDRYREGVAILSRYPLSKQDAGYVSDSHDPHNIHSRKVVMAQLHVPHIGAINVFCAHLSWWENGFQRQFHRLHEWANAKQGRHVKATLLCGDFNVQCRSNGYYVVVDDYGYSDTYLAAVDDGAEQNSRLNDYRIDYIFLNATSEITAASARTLFTEQDYGRVSDHIGYFMVFEPK